MATTRVVNRVGLYRQQKELSQEGLAILVGTSQQQISRIEKGQRLTPSMASAICKVLEQPLGVIFPAMGDMSLEDTPAKDIFRKFHEAGIRREEGDPPVTARLSFQIRGFADEFLYYVSGEDMNRIGTVLLNQDRDEGRDFIAFMSQGRYIVVRIREVMTARMVQWGDPEPLLESFTDLRIFQRGQPAPFVLEITSQALDEADEGWDYWHHFMMLEGGMNDDQFILIHDLEGQDVDDVDTFFNLDDIVVIECPTKALYEVLYREDNAEEAAPSGDGVIAFPGGGDEPSGPVH